ncbi:MAG: hypothetical protein ACREFO_02825 [Acetobacteraceae bacterium]
MTAFDTQADVMLSERALDAFFPADAAIRERMGRLAATGPFTA